MAKPGYPAIVLLLLVVGACGRKEAEKEAGKEAAPAKPAFTPGEMVLVPGGVKEARAFRSVLLEMGKGTATPEPPAPPVGKLFAQAMLRAGARALARREVAIAESPPASPSEWLIRWVGRLGTETLATEGSVARAAEDAGRVIFCLLPLAGDPDLVEHDPDLAGLVEAHTHILVGQAHGRSWLGSARAGARLAGVS